MLRKSLYYIVKISKSSQVIIEKSYVVLTRLLIERTDEEKMVLLRTMWRWQVKNNLLSVQDVVGYNTFGHGFFIEDGIEENNVIEHNLGILVKPGIILPTDRSDAACAEIGAEETFFEVLFSLFFGY